MKGFRKLLLLLILPINLMSCEEGSKLGIKMVPIPGENYEMMSTEVTQELYESVMGTNPSGLKGSDLPVESVSWYDAINFCNALSKKLGVIPVYTINGHKVTQNTDADGFRLPTVEEWLYAAKGGQDYTYSGSDNLDEVGWYKNNSGNKTNPVAQKKPNGYGLYDMSGNVWEWCFDSFFYTDRRICGGMASSNRNECMISTLPTHGLFADERGNGLGFRVVRTVK